MSSPPSSDPRSEQVGPFQFAVLAVSVLALGAIALDSLVTLPREISRLLLWVDHVACAAFFADFVIRFRAAESKLAYLKWGWIDLLASVPNIPALRFGRLVWVFRILRLLRGVQSLRRLLTLVFVNRRRGGAVSVGMIVFVLIVLSSAGMLWFERGEASNIRTAGDAVWWSITTVTTVGYGDHYPLTPEGRMIAGALMVAGVGLFGAFSGLVASLFLGPRGDSGVLLDEIRALRAEVEHLRASSSPGNGPRKNEAGGPPPSG